MQDNVDEWNWCVAKIEEKMQRNQFDDNNHLYEDHSFDFLRIMIEGYEPNIL
jgi:hypothetical protein